MGNLIYFAIVSLDGYHEDRFGNFDWAQPDDEVHAYINDLERDIGTYLYGRRMYETMAAWETDPSLAGESNLLGDFAQIWQGADKVVFSSTLKSPSTKRTRFEREFDPDLVRELKSSVIGDLSIGGPELAAEAFAAGLIDECQMFVVPVIVGGGKPAFPDDVHLELNLIDEHRFGSGTVLLRYRSRR